MSKLKLIIPLIIVLVLVFVAYNFLNDNLKGGETEGVATSAQCQVANEITWCQYEEQNAVKAINVALFRKGFELNFTAENAQSLKEQAILNSYVLAINASYYRNSPASAEHAGLLQLQGEEFEPLTEDSTDQVNYVVIYDTEVNSVVFLPIEDFDQSKYADEKYTLFQTGPIIISDNKIENGYIEGAANGEIKALRTLLGYTSDGEIFVVVTRLEFTLKDVAQALLNLDLLKGKRINVINLDGGSSTAMYSQDLSQFNWWNSKRLPVIIGVK